jgi:hypothetical protein
MSGTDPTQPIPPSGSGWGQPPPPRRPPDRPPPAGQPPWWRRPWAAGLIWGIVGFLVGAAIGNASAEQEPPTVTVTSIVTSIVPASTTTTTEPETTTTARAATTTRRPTTTSPPTTRRRTTTTNAPTRNCDPSYPDFCIPPPPPDLDCPDINASNFTVQGTDPHGFDADNDGVGCES